MKRTCLHTITTFPEFSGNTDELKIGVNQNKSSEFSRYSAGSIKKTNFLRMKKIFCILSFVVVAMGYGCQQPSGLTANQVEGTSKWVMASYLDELNKGEYEKSLLHFLNNPVESRELNMNDYIAFADNSITNKKTIDSITLNDNVVADVENTIEMQLEITYSDGSKASKWVQMQQVDGIWKLTTRGSLF